jgi:hypothetical protein
MAVNTADTSFFESITVVWTVCLPFPIMVAKRYAVAHMVTTWIHNMEAQVQAHPAYTTADLQWTKLC